MSKFTSFVLSACAAAALAGMVSACETSAEKPSGEEVSSDHDSAAEARGQAPSATEDEEQAARLAAIRQASRYNELVEQARRRADAGELETAGQLLERALGINPEGKEAQELLTSVKARLGDADALARRGLTQAQNLERIRIEKAIRDLDAAAETGGAAYREERYDDAVEALGKALSIIQEEKLTELLDTATAQKIARRRSEIEQKLREAKRDRINQQAAREEKRLEEAARLLEQSSREQRERQEKETASIMERARDYARLGLLKEAEFEANRLVEKDPTNMVFQHFRRDVISTLFKQSRRDQILSNIRQRAIQKIDMNEAVLPYAKNITYPDRDVWVEIARRKPQEPQAAPGTTESMENSNTRRLLETIMISNFDVSDIRALKTEAPTLRDVLDHLKSQRVLEKYQEDLYFDEDPTLKQDKPEVFDKKFHGFRLLGEFPLELVLRHILSQADLTFTVREGRIVITDKAVSPESMVLMVYNVADLVAPVTDFPGPVLTQTTPSEQGVAKKPAETTTTTERVIQEQANNVMSMSIRDLIRNIKSSIAQDSWTEAGQGTIQRDKRTELIVNQTPEIHRQIQDYLKKLRKLSGLLVNVELRIITVDDNFLQDVGVDLRNLGTAFTATVGTATTLPGVTYEDLHTTISSLNLNTVSLSQVTRLTSTGGMVMQGQLLDKFSVRAILTAVRKTSKAQTLTAPTLTVLNCQRGSLMVGKQETYIKNTSPKGAGSVQIDDPEIGTVATATVLDIMPVVSPDRRFITLTLRPSLTTLLGYDEADVTRNARDPETSRITPIKSPIQLPKTIVQEVRTTVRVPDGGTVLIGGLREVANQEGRQSVPVLGDIPIVGFLFSRQAEAIQRREIIILLTSKIIVLDEEEDKIR